MYDENYDYYSQELRDYTGNLPTNPVKVHPIPNNPFETSMELDPTPIPIPPPPPPMPPPPPPPVFIPPMPSPPPPPTVFVPPPQLHAHQIQLQKELDIHGINVGYGLSGFETLLFLSTILSSLRF